MRGRIVCLVVGGLLVLAGALLSDFILVPARRQGAPTHFDAIVCRSLVITDEAGRPRISLLASDDGGFIGLTRMNGEVAAAIASTKFGGTFVVRGAADASETVVRADGGASGLWILGPDDVRRLVLSADAEGGDIAVYSGNGTRPAAMVALPEGAAMTLMGTDGQRRAVMTVAPNDAGGVVTYGPDGRVSARMPEF